MRFAMCSKCKNVLTMGCDGKVLPHVCTSFVAERDIEEQSQTNKQYHDLFENHVYLSSAILDALAKSVGGYDELIKWAKRRKPIVERRAKRETEL